MANLPFGFRGRGKIRHSFNFNTYGEEWFEWHIQKLIWLIWLKKKNYHGTERALQNDLLMALDSCCSVSLLMLDLSATFDTIYHSILLYTLPNRFGIKGKVLRFESYLLRRRQAVVVNAKSSSCSNQPPSLDRSCLAWALCVICRLIFVTLRRCKAVFFL